MKACVNCKYIIKNPSNVDELKCPVCGSTTFTENFGGLVIILKTESEVANYLGITMPGIYALYLK